MNLFSGEEFVTRTTFESFWRGEYPRVISLVAIACESRPAAEDTVHEALAAGCGWPGARSAH